jgi:putative ABC transport system substrate-binding protein
MKPRISLWLMAAIILATVSSVEAQQPQKIFRIGYLSNTDRVRESNRSETIRLALRERGYVEGHNIAFEFRYSEGKADRASVLAAELVRLKVDLIVVAGGPTWVQAAKNATKTIPIVMNGAGADPVEAGLVESLARPGGNVTGLTILNTELGGKRLELLKETVPKVTRVAVLFDAANPVTVSASKKILQRVAAGLGLTVQSWEARTADELEQVLAAVDKWRPNGLSMNGGGPLLGVNGKRIAGFASKSRLPSVAYNRNYVDAGGLVAYGADLVARDRRVAYFVDRILTGAKPADLPVEQPMKFEFVINLKTAKQIGVTIPPDVLARATEIIR